MYNTERLNARRTIIRCSAYAAAVCTTRTTAHSYSKWIKPAQKNFAWCDFTNFPKKVFPSQVIWLKLILKFVKLFEAKKNDHVNFTIFFKFLTPRKKFTWKCSDFTIFSKQVSANSPIFVSGHCIACISMMNQFHEFLKSNFWWFFANWPNSST